MSSNYIIVLMNLRSSLFGLIILVLLNGSCFLTPRPTDGIFLIPQGYTGDVIIFFNQPDGVIPEVEKGLYVYKIPKDGILKVRTQGVTGKVNLAYYYLGKNNERQRIEYLRITGDRSPSGEPQNKFGNINQSEYESGVFVMNAGGLGSFNTKNGVIKYTSFIVGSPKDADQLYDKMQKRISSFQRKFIQDS